MTFVERVVLAFGISLALIPLLGIFILSVFSQPSTITIVGIFAAVIGAGLFIGEYRRQRLTKTEQYTVPFKPWYTSFTESVSNKNDSNRVLTVVLTVVVVLSVVGLGFALTVPNYGESYSSLSLVTQQSDGEFVAAGYPETLSSSETTDIYASVTNYEREQTRYTLVVQLQRVETSSGSVSVVEYEELARASQDVAPGESWTVSPELTPEMTGSELRLVYLLYKGDAPADAGTDSAYRSTYIWVNN